jgi:hypothetical protein
LDKPSNHFTIEINELAKMSSIHNLQLTIDPAKVPKIAVGLLLGILVFGMFMVGFDQGHLFSVA